MSKKILRVILCLLVLFSVCGCGKKEEKNDAATRIEVVFKEVSDSNKYDIYLEREDRKIYKSNSVDEIYFYDNNEKHVLKEYIENTYQTTDDGIKHITDLMEETATLRDGGTKIYKSKKANVSLVKCNTVFGNKDIFIGNYDMTFDKDSMCK